MKKSSFILLLFLTYSVFGQDINYAKSVVKTLASKEFKGRGYVAKGDKIAADYIANEFKKIGVKKFKNTYFQEFTTPVNTFPSKMDLSINGKKLKAGADFLIDASSPSVKGTFNTVNLTINNIFNQQQLITKLQNARGKVLVVAAYNKKEYSKEELQQITEVSNFLKYSSDNPAVGTIFLTNEKLTWGGSTFANPKPSFIVKNDSAYQNISKITVNAKNEFIKKYQTQNVVGYIEGEKTDSTLVFTAHYDHLGMMGEDAVFPGANDNASGIAMLLNLAKHYQKNKPKNTIIFIAFGGEEIGLLGSKYFVENPLIELSKIKFLINFDLSGTGDDGIKVVNGSIYKDKFDKLQQINTEKQLLKAVKIRGEACNSDHCMFYEQKVPCFYMYTLGGIKAYHDIFDVAETLPLTEFEDYFKLTTLFIDEL